jgi:hypothetical protein
MGFVQEIKILRTRGRAKNAVYGIFIMVLHLIINGMPRLMESSRDLSGMMIVWTLHRMGSFIVIHVRMGC